MELPPIPNNLSLPDDIRSVKKDEDLTLFIGAGVSQLIGCWGWKKLAEELVGKCLKMHIIDYNDKDYLIMENDEKRHMEVISSCFNKLKQENLVKEFYSVVEESCQAHNTSNEIYSELKRLGDYYITTNYDDHFDKYFSEDSVVYKLEDFVKMGISGANISRGKLYHIHGSIKEPSSIVLTEDDYSRRYFDSSYQKFLLNIFSTHSLLFIGYALEEVVIRLLLKHAKRNQGSKQHFVLKHYYSRQTVRYKEERERFGAMGINVISYIGDEKDYDELYEVIGSWTSEIEETELVVV